MNLGKNETDEKGAAPTTQTMKPSCRNAANICVKQNSSLDSLPERSSTVRGLQPLPPAQARDRTPHRQMAAARHSPASFSMDPPLHLHLRFPRTDSMARSGAPPGNGSFLQQALKPEQNCSAETELGSAGGQI